MQEEAAIVACRFSRVFLPCRSFTGCRACLRLMGDISLAKAGVFLYSMGNEAGFARRCHDSHREGYAMYRLTMEQISFGRICRFANEEGKGKLKQLLKLTADTALFLFPGFAAEWNSVNAALNLTGAASLTVGWAALFDRNLQGEALETVSQITGLFQQDNSPFGWSDRMQLAQLLLVYSAFFDTLQSHLRRRDGGFSLSGEDKVRLTRQGVEDYITRTLAQKEPLPGGLPSLPALPQCFGGFSDYVKALEDFYTDLQKRLLLFLQGLDTQALTEREHAALNDLPRLAALAYEKQYAALAKECPSFAIWANLQAHHATQKAIDMGFRALAQRLPTYEERCTQAAAKALEVLDRANRAYLNELLLDSKNLSALPEGLSLPTREEGFVPQKYLLLPRQEGLAPEHVQEEAQEGIGEAVYGILTHPAHGRHPLVLLGHPGAGKTMLCHMLAARLLSSFFHVILIPLRYVKPEEYIATQINNALREQGIDRCEWADIREAALTKPVLLIFDGYDELLQASGKTYADYLAKLEEFQRREWDINQCPVRILVTSRFSLIDRAEIPKESVMLRLCDFDGEQINAWCRMWNRKNRSYFQENRLQPFSVGRQSKARELAGQPLLLLMLALYDAEGNQLQRSAGLNRGQLYAGIVDSFNLRERRKDAYFRSCDRKGQEDILSHARQALELAALGMYNRGTAYLREEELDADLAFLTGTPGGSAAADALGEGARTIGGFFFIHTSKAKAEGEKLLHAYEFLHNTFGEYLAAAWMLRVLDNALARLRYMAQGGFGISWESLRSKEWFSALAYTPLFSRPVVMDMISQCAEDVFAQNRQLDSAAVKDCLTTLVQEELKRCLSGAAMADLSGFLFAQQNRYPRREGEGGDDLYAHLAVYSMNLVLLCVVAGGREQEVFSLVGEAGWRRLTGLWRSVFSEKELLALAVCVEAKRDEDGFTLSFVRDRFTLKGDNALLRIYRISSVLGDDTGVALSGALGGYPSNRVLEAIQRTMLGVETEYRLQEWKRKLFYYYEGVLNLVDSLEHMWSAIVQESDYAGYMLLLCMILGMGKAGVLQLSEGADRALVERIVHHTGHFFGIEKYEMAGLEPYYRFFDRQFAYYEPADRALLREIISLLQNPPPTDFETIQDRPEVPPSTAP